MKHLLAILAGALALVSGAAPATAQTYPPIVAPGTIVPPQACAFKRADGTTAICSPSDPLPVTGGTGGGGGSGTSALGSGASYVATATAAGYTAGDLIDHIVAVDPTSGNVLANYWINSTTSTKLASAPAAANLLILTATRQGQTAIVSALGSPFQAGGSIGNTAFGINGPLPAFASTPTFNLGGLNGAATDSSVQAVTAAVNGSPAVRQPDAYGSGTIAAGTANAAYTMAFADGKGTGSFVAGGLTASAAVLTAEGTYDGVNWTPAPVILVGAKTTTTTIGADGQYRFNASARRGFRLRVSIAGSGSITVASTVSVAPFDPPAPTLNADGSINTAVTNAPARDANGDLRVPIVTVTPFFVALPANTSTELLAASTTRIGYDVQCTGTAAVGLSRAHAALTSATPSASNAVDLVVPQGTTPFFQPAYVSGLGVTAYTATAQSCWGNSYARQ